MTVPFPGRAGDCNHKGRVNIVRSLRGRAAMRLGDYRTSDNVSDQGRGLGGGGFGGGGGGCLTMLLPFVLSRFGIGGVLILLLGYCALSTLGGGGGLGLGGSDTGVAPQQASRGTSDAR